MLGGLGADDWQSRAATLVNIANLQTKSAKREDKEAALVKYLEALGLYEKPNEKTKEPAGGVGQRGDVLSKIAQTYADLGDKTRAQEFYERALLLYRDRYAVSLKSENFLVRQHFLPSYARQLTSLLSAVGGLRLAAGEHKMALDAYAEALKIHEERRNLEGQIQTHRALAAVYKSMGDGQNAEASEAKARALEPSVKP